MEKFVITKSGVKVYKDYRDNVIIDKDNPVLRTKAQYPREKYNKGNVKGLSRFGSENSEDMKSWNLFRALQLNNKMDRYYKTIGIKDELENLLFWGLGVDTGKFDEELKAVLNKIEPPNLWVIQQTEPDVIIVGKKIVIFNESKLGRGGCSIDAWNRKDPFNTKHALYKNNSVSYFKKSFIDDFDVEGMRYYQLLRNYIIGVNYAKEIDREFHLAVLVTSKNTARSGLSHKEEFSEFCSHLKDASNCHFLTWEEFETEIL